MSMNRKIKHFNHRWLTHITELLPMINKLHHLSADQNVDKFHNLVSQMVANHGEAHTITRLKAMRLVVQQIVLRQPVTPVPFCKTDRDGFPKALRFLKPAVGDIYSIRYTLSVLRIIESFRWKPEYNVDTIVQPSTADRSLLEEISQFIRNWSFLERMPKLRASRFVMSNKAGPNGPATITAIQDLTALRQKEPELLQSITEMLGHVCPDLAELIDMYESHEGDFQVSKLVLLSDKACKTRIVALADWWSNTALNSLHRAFMEALRFLPSDVTYRQSDIPKLVKGLGTNLYSSDMTAFTDRFPIELETCLIEAAYGADMSRLWKQIVSERTFHHPKGGVKYACGNPMGLLSSWPVSTLTHHAVKQWCAKEVNKKGYKYLILGDDTLDTSIEVYKKYTDTISKLGVSISLAKCTQSDSACAEFAKRLFIQGVEVTGLPVHLLEDIRNKPEQVLELVRICRERGYEDSFLGPSLDCLLPSLSQKKMIADMLALPETVTGKPPLLEVKSESWAETLSQLPEEFLQEILSIARRKVFWEQAIKSNNLDVPKKVCRIAVDPYHPLTFTLSESLEKYLPETEDEYSIYNAWMRGEYLELASLPSLDTYRYANRGHRATKCKFEVLKNLLAIANGNCNIPLYPAMERLSDLDLYDLALERTRQTYDDSY